MASSSRTLIANNDWEIFAPRNARRLRRLVERAATRPT